LVTILLQNLRAIFIGLIIYLQNLVAKLLFFPEIEKNKARKMIILYFSVTLQHKIAFR